MTETTVRIFPYGNLPVPLCSTTQSLWRPWCFVPLFKGWLLLSQPPNNFILQQTKYHMGIHVLHNILDHSLAGWFANYHLV